MSNNVLTRAGYAKPGTSLNFKTGTWRVQKPLHKHSAAPCHAVCPAGEDAQAYIAHVQAGHLKQAWETLVAVNPMPAVTGRVCPHPCEYACNRGEFDEPIAIHAIERFLGDEALANNWAYPVSAPAADAPQVAIVGAGPGGIAAAYHLLRLGYRSVIFDDHSEAGGTLRTALPPYRLPRSVLDAELGRILALPGIEFRPGHRLGRDFMLNDLQDQYAAVFLAPGAQHSAEWSVDGVVPANLKSGLELLREWIDVGKVPTPRSVAVVGAGNTAVDIARVMKRAGVAEVHIISHKPIPGPGIPPSEAMPAIPREVKEALEEGIIIHEYRGIRRLILRGEQVVGLELVRMKKLMQPSGRLKRVAFEGTETVLNVDQVVPAIGQKVDDDGLESIMGGKSYLQVDDWGRLLSHPTVLAGGDASNDLGILAAAVGDGRRAAQAIHAKLQTQALPELAQTDAVGIEALNLNYYEPGKRVEEPALAPDERSGEEEITATLPGPQIRKEAGRCFSCGNCLACDNCWTLCPDSAVLKTTELATDGSHYVFDYDYCKGCGLCAEECPCGYIEMKEDL